MCPTTNALDAVRPNASYERLINAMLPIEREMVSGASAMICLVGRFRRHEHKYGEGGYRMMVAEAGHISQNLVLAGTALGLAARPFGGVLDNLLNQELGLDEAEEQFLLSVLIGHGPSSDGQARVGRDGMRLEYENGAILVENAEGRRWQLKNVEKPLLKFEYDALLVNREQALRRVGANVHPLTDSEIKEVAAFVGRQQPPPGATLQRQIIADLKAFAYGLINTIIAQLEYDSLLDVQITGRAEFNRPLCR